MRIALIQTRLIPGARRDNVEAACAQVRETIREFRHDLIMLPEAFAAYIDETGRHDAETLDGETVGKMQQLACDGNCPILFGMLRRESDGVHNSAVLVDGNAVLGVYDKTHLFYTPSNPLLNEQACFARGESLGLFDTPSGRLGVMICHDGTYPELPRALILKEADIICWLMNNGNVVSWAQHYARWYLAPVAIANPVATPIEGVRPALPGGSVVVDGDGSILAQAEGDGAQTLTAEVDLARWREIRATGEGMQAVYRVRRPDLYGPLSDTGAWSERR